MSTMLMAVHKQRQVLVPAIRGHSVMRLPWLMFTASKLSDFA